MIDFARLYVKVSSACVNFSVAILRGAERKEDSGRYQMRCFTSRAQLIVKRRVKGMAMEIGSTSSFSDFELQSRMLISGLRKVRDTP